MKSGASLKGAITSIVEILTNYQHRMIKDYTAELNLWILMYLLLAVALPALGITFVVILSSLAGASIQEFHIWLLVGAAIVNQIVLTGFIKNRIPKVYY